MYTDYRVRGLYTDETTQDIIATCYDVLYGEEFERFLGQPDTYFGKENASSLLQDPSYEISDELRAEIESIFGVAEFDAENAYDDGYQFYDFGEDEYDEDEEEEDFVVPTKNLRRESFNLREALNKIDLDTYNKYDLLNLYEACDLKENEKRALANIVYDQNDPEIIYDTLNDRFVTGKEVEMPDRVKDGVIHEDVEVDYVLAEDEIQFFDEKTGNIQVYSDIMDYEPNRRIKVKFTDDNAENIQEYKMTSLDGDFITLEWIGTINESKSVKEGFNDRAVEFYNGYIIAQNIAGEGWDIYSYDGAPGNVKKVYLEDEGYASIKSAKAEIDRLNKEAEPVEEATNSTLSRLSRSGFSYDEVASQFHAETGLWASPETSAEFKKWASDWLSRKESKSIKEATGGQKRARFSLDIWVPGSGGDDERERPLISSDSIEEIIETAYNTDLDYDEAFYLTDWKGIYYDLDQCYDAEELEDAIYNEWRFSSIGDMQKTLGKILLPQRESVEDYGCDICAKRHPQKDINWFNGASLGVCPTCYDNLSDEEREHMHNTGTLMRESANTTADAYYKYPDGLKVDVFVTEDEEGNFYWEDDMGSSDEHFHSREEALEHCEEFIKSEVPDATFEIVNKSKRD